MPFVLYDTFIDQSNEITIADDYDDIKNLTLFIRFFPF